MSFFLIVNSTPALRSLRSLRLALLPPSRRRSSWVIDSVRDPGCCCVLLHRRAFVEDTFCASSIRIEVSARGINKALNGNKDGSKYIQIPWL